MKLFYIANIRFPTERAHGIQVAHMCAAFAKQMRRPNADLTQTNAEKDSGVTLLVPDRKTFSGDPFAYYGVLRDFTIEKIPVPDVVRFGRAGFLIESLVFARRAARRARIESRTPLNPPSKEGGRETVVYTREELPLLFLPRRSAWYEAHQLRHSFFFKWLIRRARGIIAITQGLKEALVKIGYPRERIMVAPDGYDEKQFAERVSHAEARGRLGLPQNGKIAMYIGGLEPWKGAEILCKAAMLLAHNDILVAIIGGTRKEITPLMLKYPNVVFLGARPYHELSLNQQAADILVMPNSGEYKISKSFTSPLKLFAHMASGVPLVASELPSLREILSGEDAEFFTPDAPEDLVRAIRRVFADPAKAHMRAERARRKASAYTWNARARRIIQFLDTFFAPVATQEDIS